MSRTEVQHSLLESNRFGLKVGRWFPMGTGHWPDLSGYDVVIVRHSSGTPLMSAFLANNDTHTAIHADTLAVWRWNEPQVFGVREVPLGRKYGTTEVRAWMQASFVDYENHYAANPIFDRTAALAGYAEWAEGIFDLDPESLVTVGVGAEVRGFALVDWTAEIPNIRLNAVLPEARGQGWFSKLITETMHQAKTHGYHSLESSTQVQNVAVQRTWAALGWRPEAPLDTTHLVRNELFR